MLPSLTVIGALLQASSFLGQVISYEATTYPEDAGWSKITYCSPFRWLADGMLHYQLQVCPGSQPPTGQTETFTRSIAESSMGPNLFFEWQVQTDGDRTEIDGTAPTSMVIASSSTGVSYHFTVAKDQVRFIRGNLNPITYFDIAPGVAHTHRLELHGSTNYAWYIDGNMIDSGVPEDAISYSDAVIQWRSKSWHLPSSSHWDCIRYGKIPADHSGDFDRSGIVDLQDLYFFVDCLLGPDYDAAGPGCKWADMNADGVANGDDIPAFTAALQP